MTRQAGAAVMGWVLAGSVAAGGEAPAVARRHALMPVPSSLEWAEGRLALTPAVVVALRGHRDARLQAAVDRMVRRLESRTTLEFARGAGAPDPDRATLVVEVAGPAPAVPRLGEDESYTLDVDGTRALLRAPTVTGALRGLETVLQLVEGDRGGWFLPAVRIRDRPRFPWRGLLIDVCRHFIPPDVVRRQIDAMAAVKLNVLHLHLTEDQGFRIESLRFPRLHQRGSDGLYYTQGQVRDLVNYAAERGIRVVPEFDMPGHATSWLVGHPELGSAPGPYEIALTWGIFDPSLDPTREEVYRFLDRFLGEMAALFPDAYLHIGGDENTGKQWQGNPAITAFMARRGLADAHALQAYFNQRIAKILAAHGKRMVGWDEVLHPDLPRDIVVQSWRGADSLADGARRGYQGILSNGYYLDFIQTAARHYLVDPLPAGHGLSEAEAARVLGGEVCQWGEFVWPETIDSRIWPRTAAIAERLWSPREVADVDDMYRRLARVSVQLEEHGLMHETHTGLLLRRLAGTAAIGPLETLAGLVEPVKVYERPRLRPATQFMPLTRLVDAARPDSAEGRRVATLTDDLLSSAPRLDTRREALGATFTAWRATTGPLRRLADQRPSLREMRPLVDDLDAAAALGLEALSFIEAGQSAPVDWRDHALARLDEAAKPKGEVEIVVLGPLRQLVVAASRLGDVAMLSPAEWKRTVVEQARAPEPK